MQCSGGDESIGRILMGKLDLTAEDGDFFGEWGFGTSNVVKARSIHSVVFG